MMELVDMRDLGSRAYALGFESPCPHQKSGAHGGAAFLMRTIGVKDSTGSTPSRSEVCRSATGKAGSWRADAPCPHHVGAKSAPLIIPAQKGGDFSSRSLAPHFRPRFAAQPLAALPLYGCGVPPAGASLDSRTGLSAASKVSTLAGLPQATFHVRALALPHRTFSPQTVRWFADDGRRASVFEGTAFLLTIGP